jgi:hypothetical protein
MHTVELYALPYNNVKLRCERRRRRRRRRMGGGGTWRVHAHVDGFQVPNANWSCCLREAHKLEIIALDNALDNLALQDLGAVLQNTLFSNDHSPFGDVPHIFDHYFAVGIEVRVRVGQPLVFLVHNVSKFV